jgi:hypothetical protein
MLADDLQAAGRELRADGLADDLRATQARTAQDPPQPAVPGCAG